MGVDDTTHYSLLITVNYLCVLCVLCGEDSFLVWSCGAASAGAQELADGRGLEALAYEKCKEPPVFGRIADRPAATAHTGRECPLHQRTLIDVLEDLIHRATGKVTVDADRFELAQDAVSAVTLDDHIRAGARPRSAAIVECAAALKPLQNVVNDVGRNLPCLQPLPKLKFAQLAKGEPFKGETVRICRWLRSHRQNSEYRIQNTEFRIQNGNSEFLTQARSVFRIPYSVFCILYSVFCLPYPPNRVMPGTVGVSSGPVTIRAMSSLAISEVVEIPWTFSLNSSTFDAQRRASS